MPSDEDLQFLSSLSMFAGLRAEVVNQLVEKAERIELGPGEVLFEEDAPAAEMLVVRKGRLDVVKHALGSEARIATLGPGDVVGEMSLIDIQPRSAAVRAVDVSTVVVLKHADIATLYREDPPSYTLLVLNIAREISLRLRRLDKLLATVMVEIEGVTRTRLGRGVLPE